MKTVCVIGLWHLGLVNSVGFAMKGFRVIGLDFNRSLINKLKKGKSPIFEPGLEEQIGKYLKDGRLIFVSSPKYVRKADFVVIAYDSQINEKGEVDISPIVDSAYKIAPNFTSRTLLVITSQVPLGTSEKIEALIKKRNRDWQSEVIYVPENLRLGNALKCFLQPDMIVLGVRTGTVKNEVLSLYQHFNCPKISMNLRSAEMVKHALNAFLATAIAFGNEIAALSEKLGCDAVAIAKALKLDRRVGGAPILPGLGYSGGTLARDLTQLRKFARIKSYTPHLLEAIVKINEATFDQILIKLREKLGNLKNKKIGILGLTYKPGTSTLRQSPAVKIIKKLREAQANCLAYDPKVNMEELKSYPFIKRVKSVIKLSKECDALVLLTEWPQFYKLHYGKLAKLMSRPIMIDTKNFLEPDKLADAGFEYEGYGR